MDILKVERHTEGGCVYRIRFFSRSSVRPAPARASALRRMVFTASPRTKRSKRVCCRCRGKTCLQITKTAYRAKNSVDGFQLRQQESNLRWGSQSPLPYRLAMAHCRILFYPNFPAMSRKKTVFFLISLKAPYYKAVVFAFPPIQQPFILFLFFSLCDVRNQIVYQPLFLFVHAAQYDLFLRFKP